MIKIILLASQFVYVIHGLIQFPSTIETSSGRSVWQRDDLETIFLISYCPLLDYCSKQSQQNAFCQRHLRDPIFCYPLYYLRVCPHDDEIQSTESPSSTLPPRVSPEVTEVSTFSTLKPENWRLKQNSSDEEPVRRVVCGVKQKIVSRDVKSGFEAIIYDWPWIVALFMKSEGFNDYEQFCGGSIISENVILTAAHCVSSDDIKLSELFIGIGASDLDATSKMPIQKIIVHPNYIPTKHYHDIALLITSTPIRFTDKISPICCTESLPLNTSNDELRYNSSSEVGYVAGWGQQHYGGLIHFKKLREVKLSIVTNSQCNQSYLTLDIPSMPEGIRDDQLCAETQEEGIDACAGYGGGPLIRRTSDDAVHYQIGIVSFGRGCGDPNHPGVYTRITEYVPWIEQQLTPNNKNV